MSNSHSSNSQDKDEKPVATRTRRFSRTSAAGGVTSSDGISLPDTGGRYDKSNNLESGLRSDDLSDQSNHAVTIDDLVSILQKEELSRTEEELRILEEWSFMVPTAKAKIKAKLARKILKQRAIEREESIESIEKKVDQLASLIEEAKCVLIYTGAGISTSASIPDYRGPNGLWTQIKQKGHFSLAKFSDLSAAEPTLTHMAIKELCRRRIVSHVVSQNCDGLHLRSGIPQNQLSEIHGDMYIEVCPSCEKQYFRQADVTDRTSRFRHKTGRKCHSCPEPGNNLIDTIVLFGERSRTTWPMNWERASKAAKAADLIICMGSSLKTLVRYHCLWPKRTRKWANKEPDTKLVIINLQYTSKDDSAVLKIMGKCDIVMKLVMQRLNIDIPTYDWSKDPLLHLATPFTADERANLRRNLIFESREKQSSTSNSMKRPLSTSPSLFVSELTDDPEKKKLKMRIRAINMNSSNEEAPSTSQQQQVEENSQINAEPNDASRLIKQEPNLEDDAELIFVDDKSKEKQKELSQVEQLKFALPGWLGKSLGNRRANSYRRKRHGNKGRKHNVQKQQPDAFPSF